MQWSKPLALDCDDPEKGNYVCASDPSATRSRRASTPFRRFPFKKSTLEIQVIVGAALRSPRFLEYGDKISKCL